MSDRATQSAGFHSNSDDTWTSQVEQPSELRNGKETRGWISEVEWKMSIRDNSDISRASPSIFRVPNDLKKQSEKGEAYIPKRVSLGPYHHRSTELPPMTSHKGRALHRMMTRAMDQAFPYRARDEIKLLEDEIRNSYEEKIDCNGETLALMLSLDGCFIIEILRTLSWDMLRKEQLHSLDTGDYYEPLFHMHKIIYTRSDILHDILKLENQIPFIVLRKLLELELPSAEDVKNKLLEMLDPLIVFYPFKYKIDLNIWFLLQQKYKQDAQEIHHLLCFLHILVVAPPFDSSEHALNRGMWGCMGACMRCGDKPYTQLVDNEMNDVISVPRAVELKNAGIKFKPCAGGIGQIHFDTESATIYLPPIIIADSTEILFRNLVAYEMCKPSPINYVACYLSLMDDLIDSQEDVASLRKMDIITNALGSDLEVAQLFNGLCKGVNVSLINVFEQLTQKVYLYHKNKCMVHCAELESQYFSSPWRILGLVAGTVLLLLTVVQTICSILSVHK